MPIQLRPLFCVEKKIPFLCTQSILLLFFNVVFTHRISQQSQQYLAKNCSAHVATRHTSAKPWPLSIIPLPYDFEFVLFTMNECNLLNQYVHVRHMSCCEKQFSTSRCSWCAQCAIEKMDEMLPKQHNHAKWILCHTNYLYGRFSDANFRIENNFRNFSSPNETRKSHLFIITFQQPKRKRNWKQRVNAKKIFRTQTVVERLSKSFVLFLLLLLLEGYPERVAATETNTSKNGSNIRQHSHVE